MIKHLSAAILLLLVFPFAQGQKTTVKTGTWSDAAVWNNHATPTGWDSVALQHDITVDVNSACRVLKTNGHQVHVDPGIVFNVGNSANSIDTATLLTMVSTYYWDASTIWETDTTIIKNDYINGHKRIRITTIGDDETTYTDFEYDSLGRLAFISLYFDDPFDGIFTESLIWNNNRLVRAESGWDGYVESARNMTYISNGANIDIHTIFERIPQQDTIYAPGGEVVSYSKYNRTLTADANWRPLQVYNFSHYYHNYGAGGANINEWDTTRQVFRYDAIGNLMSDTLYLAISDTNWVSYPTNIRRRKDTTIQVYTRPLTENAQLHELLRTIFGDTLLMLSNTGHMSFYYGDVLGDPTGYSPYEIQTQSQNHFRRSSYWTNGMEDPGNAIDEIAFTSNQLFDTRHRLIRSTQSATRFSYYQVIVDYIYP